MVMDNSAEKSLQRKIFRQKRKEIAGEKRTKADENIFENLKNLECIKNADLILTFISYSTEPDTKKFAEYILNSGKRLAAAKCTEEKGIMFFHEIKSFSDLEKGMYGIPEPKKEVPSLKDEEIAKCKAVCIVPGLSFSEDGYRLGYGGGYYDRFLESHKNVISVGICFDELLSSDIPIGEYDMPVEYLVTDKKAKEIIHGR